MADEGGPRGPGLAGVPPADRVVALAEMQRQLLAGTDPVVLAPEVYAWFVDTTKDDNWFNDFLRRAGKT